jgi:hypothetical protein
MILAAHIGWPDAAAIIGIAISIAWVMCTYMKSE